MNEDERRKDSRSTQFKKRAGIGPDRRQNPPKLTKCPQCGSMYCGPYRCRFSNLTHEEASK